jgi:hypothetical protein
MHFAPELSTHLYHDVDLVLQWLHQVSRQSSFDFANLLVDSGDRFDQRQTSQTVPEDRRPIDSVTRWMGLPD